MEFWVLGPLEVRRRGTVVPITAPKLRALLLLLLLDVGRTVAADRLVDDLWGDGAPPQPMASLRSYVSNLRRLLQEPDASSPIVTRGRGYALEVEPDAIDAHRFERLAGEGRRALVDGDATGAVAVLDSALRLWRGEVLADVAHEPYAAPLVAKFDELRRTAVEDRSDALLAAGRHAEVLPELESYTAGQPLRERPRRQLMLALYRAGRAADALEVHARFRAELVDAAGLDPSPEIVALSEAILRQDPALDPPRTDAPAPRGPADAGAALRSTAAVVGRERERRSLSAAIDALTLGRGGVVLVGGEPGIGKTALLQELARDAAAAGIRTAWGRCVGTAGVPALWPWVEVLRALTAGTGDDRLRAALAGAARPVTQLVPDLAERLDLAPVSPDPDPQAARFALYDAVSVLLGRLTGSDGAHLSSGVVIALDDLHWADTATLQLLDFLATRGVPGRILLAGSYRDAAADRSEELDATLAAAARQASTTALELRPLPTGDVASIVVDLAGTPSDRDLLDDIVRRSGGNPFFVRQLATLARDTARTGGRARIPLGVRHVILQRIQQLPAEVRGTLDIAATIGQSFDVRTVAAAREVEILEVLDHIDVAIRHGLVDVGEATATTYRFVHALVRETLEAELTPGRASRMHAAIADALERLGTPPPAALAAHLWHAADLVPAARIVPHLRAAAEDAFAVTAYEQGGDLLRRALHLLSHATPPDPDTEVAIRLRLVQVLIPSKGWVDEEIDEVSGRVRDLVGRAQVGPGLVSLWWSSWTAAVTRGHLLAAADLSQHLLEAVRGPEGGPVGLVAAHLACAYTEFFRGAPRGPVEGHIRAAHRAAGGADVAALAVTPEHLAVSLHVAPAITAAITGDAAGASVAIGALIEQGRATGAPLPLGHAHFVAAWSWAALDRPERTITHADAALAVCREAGFTFLATLTTPLHAWAAARCGGEPEQQAERLGGALTSLAAAGHRHALPHWYALHAEVCLLAADTAAAAASMARARQLARTIGEDVYEQQWNRVEVLLDRAATS